MEDHEFGSVPDGVAYVDRPGAYAVIEDDAGLIAVIATGRGWFLPGGGMDAGETAVDALQREVLEETGYEVSLIAEIGAAVDYVFAADKNTHFRLRSRFYHARLGPKVADGAEPDHRLVWLARDDAPSRLTRPSQAWAVERMSARR